MEKEQEKKEPPKGFSYREQHAVIVKVATEKEQKEVFEKLKELGFTDLKVVSV
jgi:hypothetical protein